MIFPIMKIIKTELFIDKRELEKYVLKCKWQNIGAKEQIKVGMKNSNSAAYFEMTLPGI